MRPTIVSTGITGPKHFDEAPDAKAELIQIGHWCYAFSKWQTVACVLEVLEILQPLSIFIEISKLCHATSRNWDLAGSLR
jgi:hypothetical protein